MPPVLPSLDVRQPTQLFKALGDETRLRIVALLTHGELCVCHLETALSITQPNASRHLGVLRSAGLVEARREGSWVYYRLSPQTDEVCRSSVKALKATFGKRKQLARDVERLVARRGPASCR